MDTEVNVPLLRKAVEWAEAEAAKPPELCEWEQARYILPNADDATGRLLATYGGQEALERERKRFGRSTDCGTCFCIAGKIAFDAQGSLDYFAADAIATDALGISEGQARRLFHYGNTIEDVRRIAESIAGERL